MRPVDVQHIGQELAVKWEDGSEDFIPLQKMRLHCPCAGCQGEKDVMGNLYKPVPQKHTPASYQLVRIEKVGGYALQPVWRDGHSTGLYSFDYLQKLARSEA